ncbi:MAG: D-alanyl-D-alanine carboxypeptidase family protein [Actinomycetales bacterium]|jgi:D-alanyl-D-alanine dipeptidase|nr:D-alanyl-D-alanine carboxypeptidase family protein [Actinomycetales bacterium]
MRKTRVFIGFLLVFSLFNEVSHASDTIPLSCMNKKTLLVHISNVIKGCEKTEVSLGAGAIPRSLIRPTALDEQVVYRFKAAQAAAAQDGQKIYIVSGYRTLNRQKTLFNQAVQKYKSIDEASKWVAPPLVSHHPWGIAIDVNYPDDPIGASWLETHGYKFGLCRVFENEWWHFEPVIAPGWKCPSLVPDARYSKN